MDASKPEELIPAKNSSPWGKVQTPPVLYSLEDVMSEQLADQLQKTELETLKDVKTDESAQIETDLSEFVVKEDNCDNDFLLAQLLQLEMDKEYDELLKEREKHKNKNSRIAISFDKFKSVHPITDNDEKELNRLNEPEVVTSEDSEDGS